MREFLENCWWLIRRSMWAEEARFILFVGAILGTTITLLAAYCWSFYLS